MSFPDQPDNALAPKESPVVASASPSFEAAAAAAISATSHNNNTFSSPPPPDYDPDSTEAVLAIRVRVSWVAGRWATKRHVTIKGTSRSRVDELMEHLNALDVGGSTLM